MRLEGQVAIVTGASKGIGQAIALTLSKEGAIVIVNGRNIESIKKVVDEVKSLGGQALPVKADVSNSKEVNKLVETTLDKYQKIDILVNNAGINELVPTLELTENQWYNIIDSNLKSQFLCSQAVARLMIEQKRGKIVNIASIGAHVGTPGQAAYAASKAGIVQLTGILACDVDICAVSCFEDIAVLDHYDMLACCKLNVREGKINAVREADQVQVDCLGADVL